MNRTYYLVSKGFSSLQIALKQSRDGNKLTEFSFLTYLQLVYKNIENIEVYSLVFLLKSREQPKTVSPTSLQVLKWNINSLTWQPNPKNMLFSGSTCQIDGC